MVNSKKYLFKPISIYFSIFVIFLSVSLFVGAQTTEPIINSISPSTKAQGEIGFTLTISGSGFTPTSIVYFNGFAKSTNYISSTQLIADIPSSDLDSIGTFNVTVDQISNIKTFIVENPTPIINTISPEIKNVGDAAFTISIDGFKFVPGSIVKFNGSSRQTSYISATNLTATIPSSDLFKGGTYNITVVNPSPGGGTSNTKPFTINNVIPTITSLSNTTVIGGKTGFTLTVNGTGFSSGSIVNFNGKAKATTYVSGTRLLASIPSSDLTRTGDQSITVSNPAPGGGVSSSEIIVVTSTTPTISNISPTSSSSNNSSSELVSFGSGFTLTVQGTNFMNGSVVNFDGTGLNTTYVSNTKLTATIPQSYLLVPGNYNITITNPLPGGGTSTAKTFIVNNPIPIINNISPGFAIAGDSTTTVTITGSGFLSSSSVYFDNSNSNIVTTYNSTYELIAQIDSSYFANGGNHNITVKNPTPGGGSSTQKTFIVNNPEPVLNAISPEIKNVGSAGFTLSINGFKFVPGSIVKFNGSNKTTTYINTNSISAVIPASDLTKAGSYNITVTNPAPGGGTSSPSKLSVNNLIPTATSIFPTSAYAGAEGFNITVNGSNFVTDSVVVFDNIKKKTTFVSNSKLLAEIMSSDISKAGNYGISVVNPTPGGGVSDVRTLIVDNPLPSIASITPTAITEGSPGFILTINGNNFNLSSKVNFNNSIRSTSYISSNRLTALIASSDIVLGDHNVDVTNPPPGGGTSNISVFSVIPYGQVYTYSACYFNACQLFSSSTPITSSCQSNPDCTP